MSLIRESSIPAKTGTINCRRLLMGWARDWGAALLLVQTWVWVSVAVLPSALRLGWELLSASQLLKQSELA
jgi:hypothetical protein